MTFFTEHSEFLPYAICVIGIIIMGLLLRCWCNWCKYMKQYDMIQERELLKLTKDFHEPNIEEY